MVAIVGGLVVLLLVVWWSEFFSELKRVGVSEGLWVVISKYEEIQSFDVF